MVEALRKPLPAVPFLRLEEGGGASLRGSRCDACGAVAPGERAVCNACGARGKTSIALGEYGKLYTYTIVHRSLPGVKIPFIAAIVDLAGGGAIKGVLLDVAPDPAAISYDLPVRVVFRETGQSAADGSPFISYFFVPALSEAA